MSSLPALIEKMLASPLPGAFIEPKTLAEAIQDVHAGEEHGYERVMMWAQVHGGEIDLRDAWSYLMVLAGRIEMAARLLDRLEAEAKESNEVAR